MADNIQTGDIVLHYSGNKLLLKEEDGKFILPLKEEINIIDSAPTYFFSFNTINCFWVQEITNHLPDNYLYHEVSFLRNIPQREIAWVGAVGNQLKEWYLQNRFCGKCGSPTHVKSDERAIQCNACGHTVYPRISPAIIVAITCNDKILLAHNANFPEGLYSLIAGYVDIGESLEQTVIREIKEEVGIEVTNLRYYKSQPWPFSGSMMLGFIADADDSQPVTPDKVEISDARWFSRNNLPFRPNLGSIAGEMLEKFEKGEL
jgi:NAD+ diphosphatase